MNADRILNLTAVYLDEISDDPQIATKRLQSLDIKNACLRYCWCKDILSLSDDACGILKDILQSHSINIALVSTKLSIGDTRHTNAFLADLSHLLDLCQYFGCKQTKICIDPALPLNDTKELSTILQAALDMALGANIRLCLENGDNNLVISPSILATILKKHKSIGLIYDPALLVRRSNPMVTYWMLFKQRVSHIDIHDLMKVGRPAFPFSGDGQLDSVISDSLSFYRGWYCFEPGLGSRFNNIVGKEAVFQECWQRFLKVIEKMRP